MPVTVTRLLVAARLNSWPLLSWPLATDSNDLVHHAEPFPIPNPFADATGKRFVLC